jgi:tetratricopeptide (TPR) repeat protein
LLLAALGRFPEAVAACQRAVELEPHDTPNWIILGWCLHAAGQYVTAREALLRSLESSPESIAARIVLADIEFREGRIEEAMRISDQVQLEYVRLTVTAACEHELGRPKESQQALAKLLADHGGHAAFQISLVYARRREADEAFEWLERAYRQHDSGLWAVKMFHFGHLCSDRRYTALLRKMGLPE